MPRYTVQDQQSGRQVVLEGDSPPTEQELEQIFANLPPPQAKQQADSVASRIGTGITDPMFGAAQLITRAGAAANLPGFAGDTGLAQSVSDYVKAREADYHPPEGWDVARIIGNVVSPVNLAAGGGGVAASKAAIAAGAGRLTAAAAGGAAAGAASGAAQPVAADKNYWGDKGMQVAGGAAAGAAVGAASQKLIDAGAGVVRALKNITSKPQDIQIQLQATLKQQGIDWNALSQDTQQYLTDQVGKALRKGGEIPEGFLGNLATLKDAGVDNPTLGQITQDPNQSGLEEWLRHRDAGAALASQYKDAVGALNQRLAAMGGHMPAPLNNPEAGARVMQALSDAARRGDTYENALWGIARDQLGRDTPIGNGRLFARGVINTLEDKNLFEALPDGVRNRLANMRDGQGGLTLDVAENLKNALNDARENPIAAGAGSTNKALGVVRGELEGVLDTVTGSNEMRGAEFFRQARAASKARRVLENAIPALEDVRVQGSETAPDDFLRKFVIGPQAKVSEVTELRDFLTHADPGAWNQIRGQVLYGLREQATKGRGDIFLQDAYNKGLRSLQQSGKLDVLFSPSEVDMLTKIGKAGQLLQGPPGIRKNGLLGGARATDALGKIISSLGRLVPGVGGMLTEPLSVAVTNAPVKAATSAAIAPNLIPALEGAGLGAGAGVLPEALQSGAK